MATLGQVMVEVGADISEFEKSLAAVEKTLAQTGKSIGKTTSSFSDTVQHNTDKMGRGFHDVEERMKYLQKQFRKTHQMSAKNLANLPEHLKPFAESIHTTRQELRDFSRNGARDLGQLQDSVLKTRVGFDKMTSVSKSGKEAIKVIQGMADETKKTRMAVLGFNKDATLKLSTAETQAQLEKFKKKIESSKKALEKLRDAGDFASYTAGMRDLEHQMQLVDKAMQATARGGDSYLSALQQMGIITEGVGNRAAIAMERMRGPMLLAHEQLMAMATQSTKLSENITKLSGPLRGLDKAFLGISSRMEDIAKRGTPMAVALKLLGPTASMADLQKQVTLIGAGLMRWQMISLGLGATFLGVTAGMVKMSEAVDGRLGKAGDNFKKAWLDALTPFIKFWTTIASGIVNFGTAVGKMYGKFSKGNKTLAIAIGMFGFLFTAVMLALSPMAIMGTLVAGQAIAFAELWMMMGPVVIGLASIAGTAILVTAAIVALGYAGIKLYQNWDKVNKILKENPWAKYLIILNPVTAALYGVVAAIKGVQNLMSDSIPKADLFGKGISAGTKKALGGFMELSDKAQVELNTLAWGSETITKANSDTLIATYGRMADTIVNNLKSRSKDVVTEMTGIFAKSNVLSAAEEAKALQNASTSYAKQAQKVQESEKRISTILTTAKNEHRALKSSEAAEIATIQESMKTTAVDTMTRSSSEQAAILQVMKDNNGNMTATMAADTVANSIKSRDEAITKANEQYTGTVEAIIKMRDETHTITADQADKMIIEAQRQKDGVVGKAKEQHTEVVGEAKKQSGDNVANVNWETGEVLSKWDIFKNNVVKIWNDTNAQQTQRQTEQNAKMSKLWSDLTTTASTKYSQIKSTIVRKVGEWSAQASQKNQELQTKLSTKWGEIKSTAARKWAEIKSSITTPINDAVTKIKEKIGELKTFFNGLKLKIPKPSMPSMPKFNLETGSKTFAGKTVTYPTGIGVKWNAKGNILNSPSHIAGNHFGGEAGTEAVMPLGRKRYFGPWAKMVSELLADNLSGGTGGQGGIINKFEIGQLVVREEADINRIADALEKKQRQQARAKGNFEY